MIGSSNGRTIRLRALIKPYLVPFFCQVIFKTFNFMSFELSKETMKEKESKNTTCIISTVFIILSLTHLCDLSDRLIRAV